MCVPWLPPTLTLWCDYDRDLVIAEGIGAIRVRISEFQIDNDWVKTVRKNNRQARITYNPHGVLH